MDSRITRFVRTEPRRVYELAAAVENWPRLLPHYRWVRVLDVSSPDRRTVEMAAVRPLRGRLAIPLRWTAIQKMYPDQKRIEFQHVAGLSKGMAVVWTIERADASSTFVEIRHRFRPDWPVPDGFISSIVGEFIVNGVAQRTLATLSVLAEQPS